jgi:hypothetical protein
VARGGGFRLIAEHELRPHWERLYLTVRRLKEHYRLPGSVDDMARHIMATERLLPDLIQADPKMVDCLLQEGIPEAEEALMRHRGVKPRRKARQLATRIMSRRTNDRGAPEKYEAHIVLAFLAAVERVAGRKFSYSRRFNADPNASDSGEPEGPMLDVLLAAIDWAYIEFRPLHKPSPANAEGILSVIRNSGAKSDMEN